MSDLTERQKDKVRSKIAGLKAGVTVEKITCTRSVKGKNGDTYVGWSAGWSSVQDDVGGATDAQLSAEGEVPKGRGLGLKDAKLASYLVAMEVDLQAHDHAMAGSNLSEADRQGAHRAIKHNYTRLVTEMMLASGALDDEPEIEPAAVEEEA